jgi:hypothetical protein
MRTLTLNEGRQATADASGRAVITFQPLRSGEDWHITRSSIQNAGAVNTPECRTYRGIESNTTLIEGTYNGSLDSYDTVIDLRNGEPLLFVFSGCDVGSRCSATIDGTRTVVG